jgi:predicted metal-dependent hydrolase
MSLIHEAFELLYPEKKFDFEARINYSDKFKPYNANVKKRGNKLEFNLSKEWLEVNRQITLGLIQELLLKILHDKKTTTNTDLYNNFVRSLHIATPKTKTEPELQQSFERVNNNYFFGLLEKPNLVWGNFSRTKLASYDYHTDTITISKLFEGYDDVVDYLIYHELLHKKIKFMNRGGKSFHHTPEFKKMEKSFENQEGVENKIKNIIKTKTLKYKRFFF